MSTQTPLQAVSGEAHVVVQTLALQTLPAPHTVPQAPQFDASDFVSRHVPLQFVSPGPHDKEHALPLQTKPELQTVEQVPQCAGSFVRS